MRMRNTRDSVWYRGSWVLQNLTCWHVTTTNDNDQIHVCEKWQYRTGQIGRDRLSGTCPDMNRSASQVSDKNSVRRVIAEVANGRAAARSLKYSKVVGLTEIVVERN